MRLRVVVAALLLALVAAPSALARSEVLGTQKVLVIAATWGPEPFTQDRIRQVVFGGGSDFIKNSSFGQVSLAGDVTPWLNVFGGPQDCNSQAALATQAKAAATAAGFNVASYDRTITIIPRVPCDFAGVAFGDDVLFVGSLFPGLVAHELGHTFGLAHANFWDCSTGTCRSVEYGDSYDVMGGKAAGQYNAFEKFTLGWLVDSDIVRPAASGTYTIDQLEQPSTLPQALVVDTARNEYWFDHREPVLEDAGIAGDPVAEGAFVHAGPNAFANSSFLAASTYPSSDLLIPNQQRPGLSALLPGDTFSEAGAFALTVLDHVGTHVDVDFRWTDTTPPSAPQVLDPRGIVRTRTLTVDWNDAGDAGSGVAKYEIRLDGRQPRVVDADFRIGDHLELGRLAYGRHGVRVLAIDRAGNRGPATLSRFTIAKPVSGKLR